MKTKPRTYNSTHRTRQAAQTREAIVAAAIDRFGAHGWAGTTLGAIAERAGVSVETIYATFGSKKALLKSAMGVAIVGDTEEVPLAERTEWLRMGEGTLDERLQAAATLTTDSAQSAAIDRGNAADSFANEPSPNQLPPTTEEELSLPEPFLDTLATMPASAGNDRCATCANPNACCVRVMLFRM